MIHQLRPPECATRFKSICMIHPLLALKQRVTVQKGASGHCSVAAVAVQYAETLVAVACIGGHAMQAIIRQIAPAYWLALDDWGQRRETSGDPAVPRTWQSAQRE